MKFYFCDCCDLGLDETQLDENGGCWQCGEKPELTADNSSGELKFAELPMKDEIL